MAPDTSTTLATYWTRCDQLHQSQAEDAWQWFVDRYRGFVRDVLSGWLGAADAATATDEFWGYLFASGALRRADRSRRLRSFLVGILHNFARDWRRRNAPLRLQAGGDPPEPVVAALDLPEREEMRLWASNVLDHAMRELEQRWPDSAEVLSLFYGLRRPNGDVAAPLSVTETAGRLQRSANAVHQALHRGRGRLRRCLEAELARLVGAEHVADELLSVIEAIHDQTPGLTDG